jgi:hypothetical protein
LSEKANSTKLQEELDSTKKTMKFTKSKEIEIEIA